MCSLETVIWRNSSNETGEFLPKAHKFYHSRAQSSQNHVVSLCSEKQPILWDHTIQTGCLIYWIHRTEKKSIVVWLITAWCHHTWTNADQILQCHMSSLGHHVFTHHGIMFFSQSMPGFMREIEGFVTHDMSQGKLLTFSRTHMHMQHQTKVSWVSGLWISIIQCIL